MGRNPGALLERITAATGRRPYLLTASQEAKLTFVGAATGMLGRSEVGVVCDVGGGSTEISTGSLTGEVDVVASIEVGAVRLAERMFNHDPPIPEELEAARAYVRRRLVFDPCQVPRVALVTGGCAHTLAKLGASVLERETLRGLMARITAQPSRKARGMHRHRHRALPAGIVLFERLYELLGMPLTVAPGGLRQGILAELDADRFHDTYSGTLWDSTSTTAAVEQPVDVSPSHIHTAAR
jgi:exopolyphosphatase/pppGpp-phosphohydrolase